MKTLTEETIRQNAEPQTFARGRDYYRQGAVRALERRGDVLEAEVEGSDIAPYAVAVTFLIVGITI